MTARNMVPWLWLQLKAPQTKNVQLAKAKADRPPYSLTQPRAPIMTALLLAVKTAKCR
jgi:hypothetical protein